MLLSSLIFLQDYFLLFLSNSPIVIWTHYHCQEKPIDIIGNRDPDKVSDILNVIWDTEYFL